MRRLLPLLACALWLVGCGSDATVSGPEGSVDVATGQDGTVGADGAVDEDSGADLDAGAEVTGDGASSDATVDDASQGACSADQCTIDGQCYDNDTPNPKNPCQVCLVIADPKAWSADDTASCDDGSACTSKDTCSEGACVGVALGCDDDNPCTDDGCVDGEPGGGVGGGGGCTHTPNTKPCVDGDVCTLKDTCAEGKCAGGSPRVCDDGNACTDDTCDKKKGCGKAANTATCDDGDPCTGGEACAGGVCIGGKAKDCDDGDVCTVDSCDKKTGCQHESIADLCKDDNVCTEDSCDKKKGCVYGFNSKPCDDGSKCSAADTCTQGACKGAPVPTDDNNPCTDDACDPATGVSHKANALPCEDGSKCTLGDTCAKSACVAGTDKPNCDDKNPCTADSCSPAKGCVNANTTEPCDDGTACTKDDACKGGTCGGTALKCDDGNACTLDSCDAKTGCVNTVKETNSCRPVITVSYPPRGATIKSDIDFVEIKGKVTSGAGPITAFTLNGGKVKPKADGTFKKVLQAKPGGNTLVFLAKDSLGTERKRVQAFLWSNKYRKPQKSKPMSGANDPGIAYFLSKTAIDDGKHDLPPNDLATIFELFMQSYDIGAIIPNPVYDSGGLKVTLSNLKYGKAKVTLTPVSGALRLVATIPNVTADLQASYYFIKPKGKLTISSIVITSDIVPTVKAHKLVVDLKKTSVKLNGFDVKLSGLGGLLNPLINALKGTFIKQLETSFTDAIKKQLGPVVADALSALAFSFAFDVPRLDGTGSIKAAVVTDFAKVTIDSSGAVFWLRSQGTAKKENTVDNLGVPDRIGCGTGVQNVVVLKKHALELALSDDALNQVLYAMWLGGLLEFPVPKSLLGNINLDQYGVKNLKMKAKALLAPTVSDCNAKGELLAHVGDFRIDASLELLGQKMDVVLWATFLAGVEVTVTKNKAGNAELAITLKEVKKLDLEVNVQQDKLVGSEKVLAGLVGDSLVKGLLGALGGEALGSFELPAIDLSGTVQGLPKGTGIAIDPQSVTRKEGNTIVGGKLK